MLPLGTSLRSFALGILSSRVRINHYTACHYFLVVLRLVTFWADEDWEESYQKRLCRPHLAESLNILWAVRLNRVRLMGGAGGRKGKKGKEKGGKGKGKGKKGKFKGKGKKGKFKGKGKKGDSKGKKG